ncbi:MAG: Sel1 domain protein repeat-containing protein [Acidobacteriaceae bacterium]|nr:Sel1 domain protein repeat-containing protein [Acidobacteriaceae bacterium]
MTHLQTQADANDSEAQLALGTAYEDGNGVPQSDKEAVKWYRAAAEQGNAKAQNRLGLMFRSGLGVDQDKTEAVNWYRKAARQKNATAMFNLGTAYYNGDGIGIDDVMAYAWFFLAADFGSQSATEAVKRVKEEPKDFEVEPFEKIGDMYQEGVDLPQSSSDAIKWYRKAAENGPPTVQMKLASLLLHGQARAQNYAEAHGLCEKAEKRMYSPGAYCLGVLYQQGLGVSRDLPQAARCFNEAANMGHAAAMLRLGEMYWNGDGVKQDKTSAYEFVSLASTSNLPEAKQEKELLEKEMTPKELEKGKAKAVEWARDHHPLVLRGKPQRVN